MGSVHGHGLDHRLPGEDKLFSRILSKESSSGGNSSYRVLYYGGAAGAVPFMWEIQPGTPKLTFSDTPLTPPLTPPPSHHTSNPSKSHHTSLNRKPRFLFAGFPRLALRKGLIVSQSSSSSCSSSSIHSSTRSNTTDSVLKSSFHGAGCCFFGRPARSGGGHFGHVDYENEDDDHVFHSPASTLEFNLVLKAKSLAGAHGPNQGTA